MALIIQGPSGTIYYNDVVFSWTGSDDVTPTPSLVYSYRLEGYDTVWSPWTSSTSVQYNDLPNNDYKFAVQAKDQLGNVDPTPANISFTVSVVYVHLESEEDTKETANLGIIEFGGTNYSLPTDVAINRTVPEDHSDVISLPAGSRRVDPEDLTLEESKLLKSISLNSGGQTITVNPGETISVGCTYQLWSSINPNEIDQLFFIYSWTPSWPPPSDYYHGVYHGIPGLYPGVSGSDSFTLTAPSSPGTYYLYWCSGAHYSIPQAVNEYDQALSPPGHAKIIVKSSTAQYTAKYSADVGYLFDHWETTDGISVANATENPTTVVVSDNGTLRAVYTPAPDIAVITTVTSKTVVGRGYALSINVTIENQGIHTETFNVTACANTTLIERKEITLTNGSFTTVTFTWNTTAVPYGNYTITANATSLPGETDTADNTYIDGWVIVTIPCDVNGDNIVDDSDLFNVNQAYGSTPDSPNWNPNCDLNNDDKIDASDLFDLSKNYGKTV